MRMFYEEYKDDVIWQQSVAKLPWEHNLLDDILNKLPTEEDINLHIELEEGEKNETK